MFLFAENCTSWYLDVCHVTFCHVNQTTIANIINTVNNVQQTQLIENKSTNFS